MKKSVLSILPNFIACMPCCLRRKTRVNTIPSMRTSVSAPKFFAIRILRDFGYLLGDRSVPSRGFWRTPDLSSESACGVVLIECSGPEPWVYNPRVHGHALTGRGLLARRWALGGEKRSTEMRLRRSLPVGLFPPHNRCKSPSIFTRRDLY